MTVSVQSQDTIIMNSGKIMNVNIINRDRINIIYTVPPDSTIRTVNNDSIKFMKMAGRGDGTNGQSLPKTNLNKNQEWQYKNDYGKIITGFKSGMTDDEISGELMRMGGEDLRNAGIYGCISVLLTTSTALIPQLIKDVDAQRNSIYAVGGAAGLFGIISIVNLISGGNDIRKSGIVLQHKRVQLTPAGMVIKL